MRIVVTKRAFTLVELMIVIAIIAIIAAIAIPGLLRARISANEVSAIGALKSLATAESQFQTASIVDLDADGRGEFGYFQEMSATANPRGALAPARPGFLAANFGDSVADTGGIAAKSGYQFVIWLPGGDDLPRPELAPMPADYSLPNHADEQETRWACYAWPATVGTSGNRAFFVNQESQVYQAPNTPAYSGTTTVPMPDAAFDPGASVLPMNLDGRVTPGGASGDGQPWNLAGG